MTDHENLTVRLWDVIHDARSTPSGHAPTSAIVAAVLPIVAEEVRKAKAEALREAADGLNPYPTIGYTIPQELRDRAAEYESGDSDEHR